MRRFFSTRRFFLCGKNKISILNPCSSCSTIICTTLYRLVVLGMFCLLVTLLLERDAATKTVAPPPPPPVASSRIFCIISTYGYRHNSAAVYVKRTWAQHCDQFLVVSDDSHEELEPAVFMNLPDKWHQLRAHLEYVYKYHFDDGDWFLYANDDNFVVIENLRHMLLSYKSEELIYFGCKLRSLTNQVYMYDGSSMVFSSATLRNFVLQAMPNETLCTSRAMGNAATEELGRCLSKIHVQAGDSRDYLGYHRFLPFELKDHLGNPLNESVDLHKNFLARSYYHVPDLIVQASVRSISSHVNYMPNIYNLFYLTYKVKHFGMPLVKKWHDNPKDEANGEGLYEP
ncbi:glycoprotein-N-acetylgalactosamine 3-beta-galactosyltransferase 1-like [Drosophila innubila]|uniref:glycoprotein-N-acetylgalactosamine 3-beta-galactosyltransferase 1-like n=1 Tax=Drosophila innubila TaxID=198719 RepID=UPI00148C35E1|nr:glycoprotein-N-acetylgalactosamine 3-beta-galactosyltransferase 1-like [Drosophila innubila]